MTACTIFIGFAPMKAGSAARPGIGIDTVNLEGKYFTAHVESGQKIRKGDLLVSFDQEMIQKAGYDTVTPVLITNTAESIPAGFISPVPPGIIRVQAMEKMLLKLTPKCCLPILEMM